MRADPPAAPPQHLVLLGDSIFDNAAYTAGEPDVVSHLRTLLRPPSTATLLAWDGATTADILSQLPRIPRDATHLALSVGGNDALAHLDLLSTPVRSTAEALDLFHARLQSFERGYATALSAVVSRGLPTTVCTIYNGALPDAAEARRARVALTLFNDAIIRSAWKAGCTIVDLRLICTEPADYANPIEPSGTGGAKIARVVARASGVSRETDASAYAPLGLRV